MLKNDCENSAITVCKNAGFLHSQVTKCIKDCSWSLNFSWEQTIRKMMSRILERGGAAERFLARQVADRKRQLHSDVCESVNWKILSRTAAQLSTYPCRQRSKYAAKCDVTKPNKLPDNRSPITIFRPNVVVVVVTKKKATHRAIYETSSRLYATTRKLSLYRM